MSDIHAQVPFKTSNIRVRIMLQTRSARAGAKDLPIILVLAICGFGSAMGLRALDPIVPRLSAILAVSPEAAALTASAFALAYGFGQLGAGPLADLLGRRRVLMLALVGVVLGSLACAAATSWSVLLAARIATGLFAAAVVPSSLALLGQKFGPVDRGPAIARFMTAVITGQLLGAIMMGWIAPLYGTATGFALLALAPLVGLAILARSAAPELHSRSEGALREHVREIAARSYLPRLALFGFMEGVLVFGGLPYVASTMKASFGAGPTEAGLAIAAFAMGGIAFAFMARVAAERLAALQVPAGAIVAAASLAALPSAGTLASSLAAMFLLGIGFYAMHNALQTAASAAYPSARATAMSVFIFAFFAGQGLGPLGFGAVSQIVSGASASFVTFGFGLLGVSLVSLPVLRKAMAT